MTGQTTPQGFDRRHAVSEAQETAWTGQSPPALTELPPSRATRALRRVRVGLNNASLYVPGTTPQYAAILDHGIRSVTHGIVNHVNAGYFDGTRSFFTNGEQEPYGSEGVGAHFEIGGRGINGRPSNNELADHGCVQFLPLDRVAWHAVDANAFTIGVEHAGFGRTVAEWEGTHYNEIGNSAYRAAWILRRYELGPPVVSLTYPGHGDANVWPHSAGGASWGGHQCPGAAFPWDLWLSYCKKAYAKKWMWAK